LITTRRARMERENEDYEDLTRMGRSMAQRYYEIMHKDVLSYDDLVFLIPYLGDFQIKKGETDESKINTLLTVYQAVLNGLGKEEIMTALTDVENSTRLKEMFYLSFNQRVNSEMVNPFSRMAVYSFSRPVEFNFEDLSPRFWTKWMTGGMNGYLTGSKGSGKTNFSLLLCKIAMDAGFSIVTNVFVDDPRFKNGYIDSFGKLLMKVIDNELDNKKSLILLDEMTVSGMRRKRTMAKEMLNMDEFERLTRKFDANTLYVWHMDSEIPIEVKQNSSFTVHKFGDTGTVSDRKRAMVDFKKADMDLVFHVNNIPETDLKYDTKDIAPFILDVSLGDVLKKTVEFQTRTRNNKELLIAIRSYVNQLMKEE